VSAWSGVTTAMDPQAKKKALLMVPYGLYVLAVGEGDAAQACTITWLTQCSFEPPLVAAGIKRDTPIFAELKVSRKLAVSVIGTGQKDIAFTFFKRQAVKDGKLGKYEVEAAPRTGVPVLVDAPAWIEGEVVSIVEEGDHAVVVSRVVGAGVRRETKVLTIEECGVKYGG